MGYRHKKVDSIVVLVSAILWLVGLGTPSVFAQGAGRVGLGGIWSDLDRFIKIWIINQYGCRSSIGDTL